MAGIMTRRAMLKGVAGAGTAAALGTASKRSTAFAAPAVIQDAGSKVKVLYWLLC